MGTSSPVSPGCGSDSGEEKREKREGRVNNGPETPSNSTPMEAEHSTDGPDDLELVAGCQRGDTAAFNTLVTRDRNRAYSIMYQLVRNEQDAWDLTQEGFLKAWRSIGRFRGQSSFYTWFYRILMNVGIDWLRRKQVKTEHEFDETLGLKNAAPGAATVPHAELQPLVQMADREIRHRIDAALLLLSAEHRAVIVLREIDGLDYQEIATLTGCSLGTVMSRLFYARKKLQTLLRDVYENL
jgi:RNA polymerase sigma-70 factor (ECF subfamily)